jgi:hypothetical protein
MKTSSPGKMLFWQNLLNRAGSWICVAVEHRAADLAAVVAASGNPSGA